MDDGRWFALGAVAAVAVAGAVVVSRRGSSGQGSFWRFGIDGTVTLMASGRERIHDHLEIDVPDTYATEEEARDAAVSLFLEQIADEARGTSIDPEEIETDVEDVEVDSVELLRWPRRSFRNPNPPREGGG